MNKVPMNKTECCGCGVCSNICPKAAITMQYDEEGFLYPVIDENLCIDCGLCLKYCAFSNRNPCYDVEKENCYILWHKDLSVRMTSRSGGVFVSCSDWILKQQGVVYGSVLEGIKCCHQRATSPNGRNKMCYSKYVQSDTLHIWPLIKSDLESGHKVLFSGTPCQVDALYSYLDKCFANIANLYTMDLICHGVPSPKLYAEFIGYLEKLYDGKVSDFQFRDKNICGWDDHIESFKVDGIKHVSSKWRDIYNSNSINRPSCMNCKYAAMNRSSDITFGDAWGIRKMAPQCYDNRGASVVIVNTEKGKELLRVMESSCHSIKVSLTGMMQPNLQKPSQPKVDRFQLWKDYYEGGIDLLVDKYGTMSLPARLLKKCKYCLRKVKYVFRDVYLPGFYPLNH